MKQRFQICVPICALVISLSACEIVGQRKVDTVTPAEDGKVMALFLATQYAAEPVGATGGASQISASAFYASKDSTFEGDDKKTPQCLLTTDDGLKQVRPLGEMYFDLGGVQLLGDGIEPHNFGRYSRSVYQAGFRLAPATYHVSNQSQVRSVALNQTLPIMEIGGQIRFQSGNDAIFTLPSPQVPATTDPAYRLTIHKSATLAMDFAAPTGTSFVRYEFRDDVHEQGIVCYAPPTGGLQLPANLLGPLASTNAATLSVDFIHAERSVDAPGVADTLVLSRIRHVHGKMGDTQLGVLTLD